MRAPLLLALMIAFSTMPSAHAVVRWGTYKLPEVLKHTAALEVQLLNEDGSVDRSSTCSATIVSQEALLSAAHCLASIPGFEVDKTLAGRRIRIQAHFFSSANVVKETREVEGAILPEQLKTAVNYFRKKKEFQKKLEEIQSRVFDSMDGFYKEAFKGCTEHELAEPESSKSMSSVYAAMQHLHGELALMEERDRFLATMTKEERARLFDISLLKVKGGIPPGFSPVRIDLSESPLKEGQALVVAGAGITVPKGREPGIALTPYMRAGVVLYSRKQGDDHVAKSGPSSACSGDSGGPTYRVENYELVLVGVTSRVSEGCKPGLAENISVSTAAHADFIRAGLNGGDFRPITTLE